MRCPVCQGQTEVTDTRPRNNGEFIWRRRKCVKCKHNFSTTERLAEEVNRALKIAKAVEAAGAK